MKNPPAILHVPDNGEQQRITMPYWSWLRMTNVTGVSRVWDVKNGNTSYTLQGNDVATTVGSDDGLSSNVICDELQWLCDYISLYWYSLWNGISISRTVIMDYAAVDKFRLNWSIAWSFSLATPQIQPKWLTMRVSSALYIVLHCI